MRSIFFIDGGKEGCDADSGSGSDTPELGMANVGGVFLVLLIGCFCAIIIGICEFLWNVRKVAIDQKVFDNELIIINNLYILLFR